MYSTAGSAVKAGQYGGDPTHRSASSLYVSHPALSFCWHLRLGFYRDIGATRMREYSKFFYVTYLLPHIGLQVERLRCCSSVPPEVIAKLDSSHRTLRRLFSQEKIDARILGRIEEKVEVHVRLEKRLLNGENDLFCNMPPLTQRQKNDLWFDKELAERLYLWPDRYWELE